MTKRINVNINRSDSYAINVGFDLWDEFTGFCASRYSPRKLFIVVDEKVYHIHGQRIKEGCEQYFEDCLIFQIPEGEKSKSLKQWRLLQDELLENKVERSTPLLAVGGGVTGDLGGFVASSVLRGVPLIHMPTSLLAMVDSSIGGKTGINHANGKNLIGAFYQPDAVFADLQFLSTLERREWINGIAEMLKYAAICQPDMFDGLEKAIEEGFKPSKRWLKLIRKSAVIKADIVQKDERESGLRAILNFGHSFGHALERLAGYGNISHGHAVYTGMLASVYVSELAESFSGRDRLYRFNALYDISLPDQSRIPELIEAMYYDKKVKNETVQLVLLKQWGEPYLKYCKDEKLLRDAWKSALDKMNR